jgi:hypothetical protein
MSQIGEEIKRFVVKPEKIPIPPRPPEREPEPQPQREAPQEEPAHACA